MLRMFRSPQCLPLVLAAALGLFAPAYARQSSSAVAVAPSETITTSTAPPKHLFFHVQLPKADPATHGRLLVFIAPADKLKAAAEGGKVTEVDGTPFGPTGAFVAAKELTWFVPGTVADVDTDDIAYPAGFSSLPAGDYMAQVVLDIDGDYNYSGRNAGDLISDVAPMHLDASTTDGPTMTLSHTVPPEDVEAHWHSKRVAPETLAARGHVTRVDFVSPSLSKFWGRPVSVRSWVVLPPGYDSGKDTYPVLYYTHGFGGNIGNIQYQMAAFYAGMAAKRYPPMIYVGLDESSPTGTHEFADSVNNGPWGEALTAEFIPYLEGKYRMDARASGRFLNGHSSGGWATLWLQTRYPKVFGGTWSTSPDPSDFHDFTGPDLYSEHPNMYRRPDGSAVPIMRDKGKVVSTMEQFAKFERVIGAYGGQLASFEWVFSPRGEDGRPEQMFNRDTGDVDPAVVSYWHDHYDISYLVTAHWDELKPDLDGRIHLYVGTADTFYLDGAAHRLQAALDKIGAKASFTFIPDRTHFDLYTVGDDRRGLFKEILWQMYGVARPGSKMPQG